MSRPIKIAIIGAGSATFSLTLVRDLCASNAFPGSTICFMDVDEERLNSIHRLAARYVNELGIDLRFEKTLDREVALKDSDFVINTAFAGGHKVEEDLREIAERHGYYRGHGNTGHWGGTKIPYPHGFHQYKLMLDIARDMEKFCPNAWLLQASNPVFEGCTLMTRETSIKVIGICHGHYGYLEIARVLGLDPDKVDVQMTGFNHLIYLTKFEYDGKNAYLLIDEWIENKAEEYWRTYKPRYGENQMSRAAVKQYQILGLFPIGDTVRMGYWQFHLSLEAKKKWYGPLGGFDSEIGWGQYLEDLKNAVDRIFKVANDPTVRVTEIFPPKMSREQHVPIINALVNNVRGDFQINIPNKGYLKDIPNNVVVEVPATIDKDGIHVGEIIQLPPKIVLTVLMPRMIKMECEFYAFKTGDKGMLLAMMLDDPRTKTVEQAEELLEDLFSYEFNREIAKYFGYIQ